MYIYIYLYTLAVVTVHGISPLCAAIINLKVPMILFKIFSLPFSARRPKNKDF